MYFIYLKKRKEENDRLMYCPTRVLTCLLDCTCHPVQVTLLRRPEATTNGDCSCRGIILLVNEWEPPVNSTQA